MQLRWLWYLRLTYDQVSVFFRCYPASSTFVDTAHGRGKKARSDQIDHCPQLNSNPRKIPRRSALFYFIIMLNCQVEIMTSQPTGGQTPKWLQIFHMSLLVTIAKTSSRKFEGVTLSGSLTRFRFPLDQTLLNLAMLWRIFAALNFKYFQIFKNVHFCANSWNSTIFGWVFVKTC